MKMAGGTSGLCANLGSLKAVLAIGITVTALALSACGGGGGGGGGGGSDTGGSGTGTALDLAGGTQSISGTLAAGATRDLTIKNAGIDITMMLFGLTGSAKFAAYSDAGFSTPLACMAGEPDPVTAGYTGGYPADCNLGAQSGDFYVRITAVQAADYVFTVAIPGSTTGSLCYGSACANQGSSGTPFDTGLTAGNDIVTEVGDNTGTGSFFTVSGLTASATYKVALGGIAVGTEIVTFSVYPNATFGTPSVCITSHDPANPGNPVECVTTADGTGSLWIQVPGVGTGGSQFALFLAN